MNDVTREPTGAEIPESAAAVLPAPAPAEDIIAFDPARTEKHRRRLKEVAADLGAVRDLDVLIQAAEAYPET